MNRRLWDGGASYAHAQDVLSLNVGSQVNRSIPGSKHHAAAVKPFEAFARELADAKASRIAVVGAGAGRLVRRE